MALASRAFLLSTMLASTDAALGQKVVSDPAVPARVRQALDVESGLNDGLAVPFFLVALDIANAELKTGVTWAVVSNAAAQIGWGLAGGLAAGILGGLLFRFADRRGVDRPRVAAGRPAGRGAAGLRHRAARSAAAASSPPSSVAWPSGGVSGARGSVVTLFTEEAGGFLAAVTWIGFGALALTWLPHITWQVVLYAALSLTVVRMVPVAIAMAGRGAGVRRWRSSAGSARAGWPRSCSRCWRSSAASRRRDAAHHRRRHRGASASSSTA